MKDLLDKLSSYNIFNYLLPGVLFAVFIDELTPFRIVQKDIVVGVFVYYFLGSIVSRIGSLIVEPLLRKIGFVAFTKYEDFVRASKVDEMIGVLSEANNMYRTICALMISIVGVLLYLRASRHFPVLETLAPGVCIGVVFALYLFAYRKQTAYIVKRIAVNLTAEGQQRGPKP